MNAQKAEFGLAAHMTAMTGGGMSGARYQVREQPNVATFSLEINLSIEPTECSAGFTCATIEVPGYLSYTVWRHTLCRWNVTLLT